MEFSGSCVLPHAKNKLMEVLKQKSERMQYGHIFKEDNSGGQVENILESGKTGGKETIHHTHICPK